MVDDDPRIRQLLTTYFLDEGYAVTGAANGAEMRDHLRQRNFDIILLDLVLPGGQDGLDLAREIRSQSDVPIMMLTGRDDVVDRIVGLEEFPRLRANVDQRLKSILRRRKPAAHQPEPQTEETIGFEDWKLNLVRRRLLDPEGNEVELSTGEFDMLVAFLRHAGRVLTREVLMDMTRGRNLEAFDRTIDAQIVRLRRKIETDPKRPQFIKAVRGVGYVFTGRLD